MYSHSSILVLLLGLSCLPLVSTCKQDQTPAWKEIMKAIDKYLNVALDFIGYYNDGLCQYKCSSDGYKPEPRPDYKHQTPNGCGSPLFGSQFDIGIPSITKCCNQHDLCYDTCGLEKHDCDQQFQDCLETICRNAQITLGLDDKVKSCESAVTLLFKAVKQFGCRSYLDSQRQSCVCQYDEREEKSEL